MKPTKHCFKNRGGERENGNIMEGEILLKVYCTNYELPQ
jgi:hypothetical protein